MKASQPVVRLYELTEQSAMQNLSADELNANSYHVKFTLLNYSVPVKLK